MSESRRIINGRPPDGVIRVYIGGGLHARIDWTRFRLSREWNGRAVSPSHLAQAFWIASYSTEFYADNFALRWQGVTIGLSART